MQPDNHRQGLIFKYEVPAPDPRDVSIVVTPDPGSAFQPNPSVRTTCDDLSSEVGCSHTSSANTAVLLSLRNQPPGAYFLWVNGDAPATNGPSRRR